MLWASRLLVGDVVAFINGCHVCVAMCSRSCLCLQTYTTPLLHACFHRHIDVAKFLIKKGAEWNSVNSDGMTPLDLALENRREDMIKLFNVRSLAGMGGNSWERGKVLGCVRGNKSCTT